MLGPTQARLTRVEKSLLQAYFRSVNYCRYNFVEHRTLIYVSGSLMQLCRASNCVPLNLIHILSIPQYVTYLKKNTPTQSIFRETLRWSVYKCSYIDSGALTPTIANAFFNVILTASIIATCAFVFSISSVNTFSAL